MLPLKKVAVFKISNCWWGFLGTVMTSMLLLHLPDNLSRHWGMEIDCVVPQALSCLVTLTTAAFEWFADTNLCSVTILSMVLYAIHILVSLFASRNRAGERLLLPSVHAHGAEDGFGADGALCGPRLIAVRLLVIHLLLVVLTACWGAAAEWRGGGDGRGHGGSKASAAVTWRSGHISARHRAGQGQRQLRLNLLLQGLLLPAGSVCHESINVTEGNIGWLL